MDPNHGFPPSQVRRRARPPWTAGASTVAAIAALLAVWAVLVHG